MPPKDRFHGPRRAEVRDFSVEIEGDDFKASDEGKWLIRALAWTEFPRPGEVDEALDTLGLS